MVGDLPLTVWAICRKILGRSAVTVPGSQSGPIDVLECPPSGLEL